MDQDGHFHGSSGVSAVGVPSVSSSAYARCCCSPGRMPACVPLAALTTDVGGKLPGRNISPGGARTPSLPVVTSGCFSAASTVAGAGRTGTGEALRRACAPGRSLSATHGSRRRGLWPPLVRRAPRGCAPAERWRCRPDSLNAGPLFWPTRLPPFSADDCIGSLRANSFLRRYTEFFASRADVAFRADRRQIWCCSWRGPAVFERYEPRRAHDGAVSSATAVWPTGPFRTDPLLQGARLVPPVQLATPDRAYYGGRSG